MIQRLLDLESAKLLIYNKKAQMTPLLGCQRSNCNCDEDEEENDDVIEPLILLKPRIDDMNEDEMTIVMMMTIEKTRVLMTTTMMKDSNKSYL
jgi:hypothetical protein